VNYADRYPWEGFSVRPSISRSRYFVVENGQLREKPFGVLSPEAARKPVVSTWGDCEPASCRELIVNVLDGKGGVSYVEAIYDGTTDDSIRAEREIAAASGQLFLTHRWSTIGTHGGLGQECEPDRRGERADLGICPKHRTNGSAVLSKSGKHHLLVAAEVLRLLVHPQRRLPNRKWRTAALVALAGAGFCAAEAARAVGPAASGLIATADTAETAGNNPAGLTRLRNPEWVGEIVAFASSSTDDISASTGGSRSVTSSASLAIPAVYYARPWNDRLTLGISLSVPAGIGSNPGDATIGRYLLEKWTLGYLSLAPAVDLSVEWRHRQGERQVHPAADEIGGNRVTRSPAHCWRLPMAEQLKRELDVARGQ
jgi:Outer membrane protein transport protein (OMPP1/FadL/TodX)